MRITLNPIYFRSANLSRLLTDSAIIRVVCSIISLQAPPFLGKSSTLLNVVMSLIYQVTNTHKFTGSDALHIYDKGTHKYRDSSAYMGICEPGLSLSDFCYLIGLSLELGAQEYR